MFHVSHFGVVRQTLNFYNSQCAHNIQSSKWNESNR